jgi:hypothetical protein
MNTCTREFEQSSSQLGAIGSAHRDAVVRASASGSGSVPVARCKKL